MGVQITTVSSTTTVRPSNLLDNVMSRLRQVVRWVYFSMRKNKIKQPKNKKGFFQMFKLPLGVSI
jgi:hypothetical protein